MAMPRVEALARALGPRGSSHGFFFFSLLKFFEKMFNFKYKLLKKKHGKNFKARRSYLPNAKNGVQ